MHIPDYMLKGQICPVTAGVCVLGVAAATFLAVRSKEKPSASRFAAVTALVFAAQMMNFPVQNGTSGHLLGGMLAASVLGTPFGILSMTIILTVQSLLFSDGGLSALGANIINMGLIGAGIPGLLYQLLSNKKDNLLLMGVLSWFSVVAASFACSAELAIAGTVAFAKVVPAMFGVHALIGIGEALITAAVFATITAKKVASSKFWNAGLPLAVASVTALILSSFASSRPDGLEWVAGKQGFLRESAPAFTGFMPDYIVPFIRNEFLSTGLAGLAGVVVTLLAAFCLGKLLRLRFGKTIGADNR